MVSDERERELPLWERPEFRAGWQDARADLAKQGAITEAPDDAEAEQLIADFERETGIVREDTLRLLKILNRMQRPWFESSQDF